MISHIVTYELLTVDSNNQHIREKQHITCDSESEADAAISKLLEMNDLAKERFLKTSTYKKYNSDGKFNVEQLAGLWMNHNSIKKYAVTEIISDDRLT